MRLYLLFCFSFAALCVWAKPEARTARRPRLDAGIVRGSILRGAPVRSNAEQRDAIRAPAAQTELASSALDIELVDKAGDRMEGNVAVFPAHRRWQEARMVRIDRCSNTVRLAIAPGMYKLLVLTAPGARPEMVEVVNSPVRIRLFASTRRAFRWTLRIEDEFGRAIRRANLCNVEHSDSHFVPTQYLPDPESNCRDSTMPAHGHGETIETAPNGLFDLGRIREAGCGWERSTRWTLDVEGHGTVAVSGRNVELGDRRYLAYVVSKETIRRSLRLPDGSMPANPSIQIDTLAWKPDDSPEPIRVQARPDGYEWLSFTIHPYHIRSLPLRTLQPLVRSPAR